VILGLRSPEIIYGNPPENHARMENHSVAAVKVVLSFRFVCRTKSLAMVSRVLYGIHHKQTYSL